MSLLTFFLPVVGLVGAVYVAMKATGRTLFDIQYTIFTKVPWLARAYQIRQLRNVKTPHSMSGYHTTFTHADVHTIPFGTDNYAYLVTDKATKQACVIDAGDADAVIQAINQQHPPVHLTHVLSTHKHADHCGGNQKLKSHFAGLHVVGGAKETWPGVDGATMTVRHQDVFNVGTLQFRVFHVPSHTMGSVAYLLLPPATTATTTDNRLALFSGDFLFSGGVGRFFEGGAEDFMSSVTSSVFSLPADDTLLFDGHEYTVSNFKFALRVDPDHEASQQRLAEAENMRSHGQPTTPTTLKTERQTNIFLRIAEGNNKHLNSAVARLLALNRPPVSFGSDRSEFPQVNKVAEHDKTGLLRGLRALKDMPAGTMQV